MRRTVLALALLVFSFASAPLQAETAGVPRYQVTLVLYPGDDSAAIAKRLAAMYRGTLETPVDGSGTFLISVSESGAELLHRDSAVSAMRPASGSAPSTPQPRTVATAARPVDVVTTGATSWTLGNYAYDDAGNIKTIGVDAFKYDTANRLVASSDAPVGSTTVQKQTYAYDAYGNMTSITTAGRGTTTMNVASTNRLTSVTDGSTNAPVGYDGAGNFVSYNGATYEYDPLQMMKKSVVGGVVRSYVYNASDERIATIEQTPSGNRSEWTIRNQSGQVLRRYSKETSGEWKWQEDYIYRGSHMLAAEVPDSAKVRHFHLDHLGTPRLITGNGGAEISRHNYHPFGEEINPPAGAREKKQFTGHERDAESLDYMHARFYAPYMGRFLSVDPTWESADLPTPQSWNRYSYVRNNPVNLTDPDGKVPVVPIVIGLLWLGDKAYAAYEARQDYKNVRSGQTTVTSVAKRRGLETVLGMALGPAGRLGGKAITKAITKSISMDEAVARAAAHVGGDGVMETTGKGLNFQFRSTTVDASGQTVTKIGRLDVNPADPHVQKQGPHLNVETQVNGKVKKNDHIPIDAQTIRQGDHPPP